MTILNRLFGKKLRKEAKPFYTNVTREEKQDWFANTPPWDRLHRSVINVLLDRITYKTLLEALVVASMRYDLVKQYEALGDSDSNVVSAQMSQVLCRAGNQALVWLEQALTANKPNEAARAFGLVNDTFEPAIALAKNQVVAYAGLSAAYGMVGQRSSSHDFAERGLIELAEMRRFDHLFRQSQVIPADATDQLEAQLRGLLALATA
jgi:hypothetical protein